MARGNFGERLKRERDMREVSADELTKATRISPRFLGALENEDWDKLPGGVFGRGFVRTIARYLGLDEESLLAEYDLARGAQKIEAPPPYENRIPGPNKSLVAAVVFVILLLLAGVVTGAVYGWRRFAAHRALKSSSATSATSGVSLSQPPPTAINAPNAAQSQSANASADPSENFPTGRKPTPLDLSVSASAAVHVRIIADGTKTFDDDMTEGQNLHFHALQQFVIAAANSSSVLLELNGRAMPPLGSPGASGTIVLTEKDLRQATGGTPKP